MGGVLQKKERNIHTEHTSHGEKKKERKKWEKKNGKKKRGAEYGYRTRELRLDSLMISPLRHTGINWEIAFNFSKLKPTRRSLVPYTKTKTIFHTKTKSDHVTCAW